MTAYPGVAQLKARPHRNTAWQEQALCREVPAEWFPAKGDVWAAAAAKRVCKLCPVIGDCLDYALTNDEYAGVWGGLSERERREEKRARRENRKAVRA